ncbi:MAG: hypothetical protein ABR568_23650, partial [Pyrinomonadaceae bacterium]
NVIARELARYDPQDAAEVTRRVRTTSGLEGAVDQIVDLYEEVLTEHRTTGGNGKGNQSEAEFTMVEGAAEQ